MVASNHILTCFIFTGDVLVQLPKRWYHHKFHREGGVISCNPFHRVIMPHLKIIIIIIINAIISCHSQERSPSNTDGDRL